MQQGCLHQYSVIVCYFFSKAFVKVPYNNYVALTHLATVGKVRCVVETIKEITSFQSHHHTLTNIFTVVEY